MNFSQAVLLCESTADYRKQVFVFRGGQPCDPSKVVGRTVEPTGSSGFNNKPSPAIWTSTLVSNREGHPSSDWTEWAVWEMPQWVEGGACVFDVDPSRVLHLVTREDADAFLAEYADKPPAVTGWGMSYDIQIDWPRLAQEYGGLHLDDAALRHPFFYGWDAESTAWFDTRSFKPVTIYEPEQWVGFNPPRGWAANK